MEELPPHPTTNHPVYARTGAGITNSMKNAIMDSPDVVREMELKANHSLLFSMPKTDFGRTYKTDILNFNKSDVSGYLQDQTMEELRATHIMKDYPIYSRAPGRSKEVEDFYIQQQLHRRRLCDRKPLIREPMKYATADKMPFQVAGKEMWFRRLDDLYSEARAYLVRPKLSDAGKIIPNLPDYTAKKF